jgi:hypothetical protein
MVHYVGYNIGHDQQHRDIPNFYPGVDRVHGCVVQYNGERAELTATLGRNGWRGHVLDIGTHFPPNPLATQLLAARPYGAWRPQDPPTVYGDAVLVTDNRMHWLFRPYNVSIEDIVSFNDLLSTPRDLIKDAHRAEIFFHTEPNQNDITALKMRWL